METTEKITVEWMARKYDEFNRNYFGGELPACKFATDMVTTRWGNAHVKWDSVRDGYNYRIVGSDYKITLTNAWTFPENVKECTLLHEMIHIADYYQHPYWFISYDGYKWHHLRYDAHGEQFFMPEARRLKKFGFNIFKTVEDEEEAVSTMDPAIEARIEAKIARGYVLGYTKYINSPKGEGMFFKCATDSMFEKIIDNAKRTDDYYKAEKGRKLYEYMIGYHTADPRYRELAGCRDHFKGWYMTEERWNQIIDELGDDKRLLMKVKFNLTPEEQERLRQQMNGQMEPEPPKLLEPKKIPAFVVRTTKGEEIVFRNLTLEELIVKLREKFPKLKEDALKYLINSPSCYPMGMNENKIFSETVEEVLEEMNMQQPELPLIQGDEGRMTVLSDNSVSFDIV